MSELEYKKLFDKMPVGFVLTTMEGTILDANPVYQELVGYTLEELKNLTYQQLTLKKWHKEEEKHVAVAMKEKYAHFKKEYRRKDGTVIQIDITGWIIRDEAKNPIGTASVVRKIS